MKIKVVVVDDNAFLTNALIEKLSFFEEIEIKYSAINGAQIVKKIEDDNNVDLILMDVEMPIMNGIEATNIIKQKYPHVKIIMLTVFDDDENVFKAIQAGADGYLLKEINAKNLYEGIQETLNGGAAITPSIALKTLKLLRNPINLDNHHEREVIKLTNREVEVLEQLSKALSYSDIAENLFLSVGTIRKHVENIYKKLNVHNKLEAVQKAQRNHII